MATQPVTPCPKCQSMNAVPIMYGEPPPSAFEKEKRGEIKLGGCCLRDAAFFCKDCGNEFVTYEPQDDEED